MKPQDDSLEPGVAALLLEALTPQQREFARLVVEGIPQTEAAKRAGYRGRHVASIASRLMRNEKVLRALTALAEAQDTPVGDRDAIKKQLWIIGQTGTSSARVAALQALDRIEDRDRPGGDNRRFIEEVQQLTLDQMLIKGLQRLTRLLSRKPISIPEETRGQAIVATRKFLESLESTGVAPSSTSS